MASLSLSPGDYNRAVAKQARIYLRNRYFEKNPSLTTDGFSLLARPGRRFYQTVGDGPIRGIYEAPGAFNELFVASGDNLYSVDPTDDSVTDLGAISTGDATSHVTMAACASIGEETPANLFVCDGETLWAYTENGFAVGQLSAVAIHDNDVVEIAGTYYKFTSGSVDTGTPTGLVGAPWLVALGLTVNASIENLYQALSMTGTAGTTYSTAMTANPEAFGYNRSGSNLYIRAILPGYLGNYVTTTETGTDMNWGAATLAGGGDPSLIPVLIPEDAGCISIAHINSYIIVIPSQDSLSSGRFYWIQPGEIKIDVLDYATAERSPDPITQVVVFSDQVWLCGRQTTEPWIATGDVDAPFVRYSGILFDRGVWEGTAVQVKESLVLVDNDGAVFQIAGGLKRISRPDIEERIRKAITAAAA
jgi:hypothetical protein